MENEKSTNSSSKFSIFKTLYLRWKVILVVALIGLIATIPFAILRNNVSYRASKSVMLVTKMVYSDIDLDNAVTGDIIDDVFEQIKSNKYVAMVNETIKDGPRISRGAISTSKNSSNTFIFTITYTASTPEVAKAGLEKIISFSNMKVFEKSVAGQLPIHENFFEYHTAADTITIKAVQYDASVKENSTLFRNIVVSVVLSLVLAVIVGLITGLLDNTLIDKEELEEITGANLLAFIDDTDLPVKSKKHKKK